MTNPTGPTGPTGPIGPTGPTGPTGPGHQGPDGPGSDQSWTQPAGHQGWAPVPPSNDPTWPAGPSTGSQQTWGGPPTGGFAGPPTSAPAGPPTGPTTGAYGAAPQPDYDQRPYAGQPWAQPSGAQPTQPKKGSGAWKWLVPLAALVVAALVITFLVVGGDPGVKDGDRAITNAKEFAESQTQAWEEGLPEKGLAKADGAQCFYLADEASEEVTKQLACGPVRRPLTSDKQVWDTYAYTVTPGSKDDEATAEAPDEEPQRAQELPGSTILVNGDGEQVEIDGAGLKEPDIPTADENTIWKASSFSVEEDDKGAALPTSGQANVAGLGTQFTLDSIVEVEAATIDASITQPAEGQKLYLLTLSGTTAANGFSGENTLSLNVGDQTEAIDDPSKAPVSLLVSAPDGGPLNLVVDSEGKNQTLNLITGERTGDPGTEWLYTDGQPKSHDPGVSFTLPRASQSNGVYFDLTIKVDSVSVSGYRNGEGWAADGQQFIEMAISSSGVTNSTTTVYYELDCASSTINEGTVSCQAGGLGTATITGTAAAGGQVTLNFAGQLLTSDQQYTVSNGYPVPFQTTSATVALPA